MKWNKTNGNDYVDNGATLQIVGVMKLVHFYSKDLSTSLKDIKIHVFYGREDQSYPVVSIPKKRTIFSVHVPNRHLLSIKNWITIL